MSDEIEDIITRRDEVWEEERHEARRNQISHRKFCQIKMFASSGFIVAANLCKF